MALCEKGQSKRGAFRKVKIFHQKYFELCRKGLQKTGREPWMDRTNAQTSESPLIKHSYQRSRKSSHTVSDKSPERHNFISISGLFQVFSRILLQSVFVVCSPKKREASVQTVCQTSTNNSTSPWRSQNSASFGTIPVK